MKIRIKDIAKRAGVSVGTVDRVLHNRPNVSGKALDKVNKALEEMNYRPNHYASALAYNKTFTFVVMLPKHSSEAYWQEVEEGATKAEDTRADFHVHVKFVYYTRFDEEDFYLRSKECMAYEPDGVVIVPGEPEVTRRFTDHLHEKEVPFVLLDSYIPELEPLSFFGQDSLASGRFAAKVLMLVAHAEKRIMLLRQVHNGRLSTKQQAKREVGFRDYMAQNHPDVEILTLNIPADGEMLDYNDMLDEFFAHHSDVHHCITFNSKAYILGEYLLANRMSDVQVMGYDMVPKNVECMRKGSVSYLIAQHGYQQGYSCIDVLFKSIVLKHKVAPVNYMPIDLLMKENYEFYRRTQM